MDLEDGKLRFLTVGQDSICLPPIRQLKGAFMCMKIGLYKVLTLEEAQAGLC